MIETLLAFLALYYRMLWQAEVWENEKIHDQKTKLIAQLVRLKKSSHHNPYVTNLEIKGKSDHESS